ncbi:M48 family metallopeptidase [Leeia sp.]|uniref:M48 family metallopeptidase n=1 Tax=Leeia sp. TaxID=2884678 RepID=UPI0035AE8003
MARQWLRKGVALAVVASLSLVACKSVKTTDSGVVGVSRKQSMMVSAKETEEMAQAAYLQEKQEAGGALNADRKAYDRVRTISNRLIAQVGVFRQDALRWNWEVNVQRKDEVNAYCMAGGKIMVYTGLIDRLKATDDELAAVIGHEIAHALREHSRERLSQAYGASLTLSVLGAAAKLNTQQQDLLGQAFAVAYTLPHSREHESEADLMGLELTARAGYDPRAAVSLWEKMGNLGGGKPPEILSTHPSDKTRAQTLRDAMPKVLPLYEAARKR